MQLLNAQIPYSFYVINYSNQIFRLTIGAGAQVDYTIPVGNYTATSLIAAIKTAVGGTSLTISISSINGTLTFGHPSGLTIYNDFQYSMGTILGWNPGDISSTGISITAPNPLNLLGIKTLQIRSQNLVMNNVSSTQGGQTILLANVPVSAVPFGMIDYTDKGNLISIANQELDDILIELIDGETGNYINMNGQDWCITLAFHLTKVWTPPQRQSLPLTIRPAESKSATAPQDEKTAEPLRILPTIDEQQLSFLQS